MANQSCCQRLLKGVDADFAIFDFRIVISHNTLNPFRVIDFDLFQQFKIPLMAFIPYLIGSHKYLNQKSIPVFSDRPYTPNQTLRLIIGRQNDLAAAPGDRLGGANGDTLAALNTLSVAHATDIHLTLRRAKSAIHALGSFQLDAENGDAVEKSVKRAERTDESAEHSEDEDRADYNAYRKCKLPGE